MTVLAAAADLALSLLYTSFESVGSNCEFGMVQERAGCISPGLFRNAGFLHTEQMARLIDQRGAEMFEDGRYELALPDNWAHWRLACHVFGIAYHTAIPARIGRDSPEFAQMARTCIASFRYLKRGFLENLETGRKIFVYRHIEPVPVETLVALRAAIRRHGPGWLLYVREARDRRDWAIEHREEGFIAAALPALSNSNPPVIDHARWAALARAAFNYRAMRHFDREETWPD